MGCGASSKKYETHEEKSGDAGIRPSDSSVKRSFHGLESRWDEKDNVQLQIGRGEHLYATVEKIPDSHLATEDCLARRRKALSAEAFGDWNKWQEFEPDVVLKKPEQEGRIKEALLHSPILRPLTTREEDLAIAISAFRLVEVQTGQEIIKQGETGGLDLFLLDSGKLDVFVRSSPDQSHPGEKIATFSEPGKAFGELALLHNAPRMATVVAADDCTLWSLSQKSFNTVIRDHARLRHERHMAFLRSVKLLDTLDNVQMARISDAVMTLKFKQGDYICKEGEIGDCFYLVEDGEAMARINGMDVRSYKKGGYFGELSLINDRPRAADIVAASEELSLVSLDRESFQRLLGDQALFNKSDETEYSTASLGKVRRSVTFDDATQGQAKPLLRKQVTGFIDKGKLKALLAKSSENLDDGEEGLSSLTVESGTEVVQTLPGLRKVGFDAAVASPDDGKPKLRKQGTGFVKASEIQELLRAKDDDEDEDEEEEDEAEQEEEEEEQDRKVSFVDAGPVGGGPKLKRAGTGFVRADQLQKLLSAAEDEDEDEDEPDEDEVQEVQEPLDESTGTKTAWQSDSRKVQFDADSGEGKPKLKKQGTGFINIAQLQKLLDDDIDAEDEEGEEHRQSVIDMFVQTDTLRKSLGEEYDLPDAPPETAMNET